jgi:hypothetical protein
MVPTRRWPGQGEGGTRVRMGMLFVVFVQNIEEMRQKMTMFLLFHEHKRK